MARYNESVCRLCRREGMKLFLKGDRCFKDKCAIERRNYPPGQHGRRRSKLLGYGIQLREKQKVKRIYGLLEGQFRLAFARANSRKGITGANLLEELERRLDNVTLRARLRGLPRPGAAARTPRPRHGRREKGHDPVLPRRQRPARRHQGEEPVERADQGFRRDGARARRPGLARSLAGVLLRKGRRAAEARGHQTSDPGAADRRAVLQVGPSRRGTPRSQRSRREAPGPQVKGEHT